MASPFTELADLHGNKFKVGVIGDLAVPPFPTVKDFAQNGRDVIKMELHPDDVFIVGFPKTGTHWSNSIVHMLMTGSAESYAKLSRWDYSFLERDVSDPDLPPPDAPRIFDTHLMFSQLPKQLKQKKAKIVYLERNPKDTWVSLYNHMSQHPNAGYPGSWPQFFDTMFTSGLWYGNWFDFVLEYERDLDREREEGLPIFVSSFEELKKNPVEQIEKLGRFLGYNRGRELCEQIAKANNFSTVKSHIAREEGDNSGPGERFFYRKGEVGDWKNWFTVAQNERFEHEYSARMKGSKLNYTFQ